MKHLRLAHNLSAYQYLELLLASAVATFLTIRLFLVSLGYPQLGDHQVLHLSHLIWGGALMIGAIIFFLSFMGRKIYLWTAILGGIGFGIFIDELGKYVTVNNDYFFRPAMPIIYFTFVSLFLLSRYVLRARKPTHKEYFVNSLELIEEITVDSKKSPYVYENLSFYLKKLGRKNHYSRLLRPLYHHLLTSHEQRFKISSRHLSHLYEKILQKKLVTITIVGLFLIYLGYNFWTVFESLPADSLFEHLEVFAIIIISFTTLVGLIEMFFSKTAGLQSLELAVYANIYLLQIFIFYRDQLGGLAGLIIGIATLLIIKLFLEAERHRLRHRFLGRHFTIKE